MASNSIKDHAELPADAVTLRKLLKSCGVDEYEPRVLTMLLDFMYKYTTEVSSGLPGPAGALAMHRRPRPMRAAWHVIRAPNALHLQPPHRSSRMPMPSANRQGAQGKSRCVVQQAQACCVSRDPPPWPALSASAPTHRARQRCSVSPTSCRSPTPPHVQVDDILLAAQTRTALSFVPQPPQEAVNHVADLVNERPLPDIDDRQQGLRLPREGLMLVQPGWQVEVQAGPAGQQAGQQQQQRAQQ